MSKQQPFLCDKPYEFVPLLEKCEKEKYSSHNLAEKDTYSGKLKLEILVESPLHIGSRQQDYDEYGSVIKKQMRRNGCIIVPGSSLKGVVRSIAEAVSYSCAVKAPYQELERLLPPLNNTACKNINKEGLCITCSIFGMAGRKDSYRGKVQFEEFVMKSGSTVYEKLPPLKSPSCDKVCYFAGTEKEGERQKTGFLGRKFYGTGREAQIESNEKSRYEMIAPGSVLEGEVIFQNLRKEEGKVLFYALGIGHHFTMKLGYGKPLGYGETKVILKEVETLAKWYPSQRKLSVDMVKNWAEEYRSDSPAEIKKALQEFERIMGIKDHAKGSGVTDSN